ncbi:MAG TPA: hypothetical protein VFB20_15695 [Burkholderiales bacterium]|nr:hypothetical protein [Burkholderiales bacterium]
MADERKVIIEAPMWGAKCPPGLHDHGPLALPAEEADELLLFNLSVALIAMNEHARDHGVPAMDITGPESAPFAVLAGVLMGLTLHRLAPAVGDTLAGVGVAMAQAGWMERGGMRDFRDAEDADPAAIRCCLFNLVETARDMASQMRDAFAAGEHEGGGL